MLYTYTLEDISTNTNTGIEFEIALFYVLISINPCEQSMVKQAINSRDDRRKIEEIVAYTFVDQIVESLRDRGLSYYDVSFETQNDKVGPADIVLFTKDRDGVTGRVGLSIKYANSCTLNVTGRKFITDDQIEVLKDKYISKYIPAYREFMRGKYGHAGNWHRKRSPINDQMIDEIRDAVITNWPYVRNKVSLMKTLFHDTSPIEFWVVNYGKRGYDLKIVPPTIDMKKADEVTIRKYQTSYVAFYLDDVRVGRMQVKFNNGFIESNFNHKGERKKSTCDFVEDDLEFNYGQPFGSWNFSVEE